jgi:hypothetical protein
MFRSMTIIMELTLELGSLTLTLMLKQLVKLHRYVLCGGVAACYVLCAVQGESDPAQHTVHTPYLDITCYHNTA